MTKAKRLMSLALDGVVSEFECRLKREVFVNWREAVRDICRRREAARDAVCRALRGWKVARVRHGFNRWREGVSALNAKVSMDEVARLREHLALVEEQVCMEVWSVERVEWEMG